MKYVLKNDQQYDLLLTKNLNSFCKQSFQADYSSDTSSVDFFTYAHIKKNKEGKNFGIPLYMANHVNLWDSTLQNNSLRLVFPFYLIKGSKFNDKNNSFIEKAISQKYDLTKTQDILNFSSLLIEENKKLSSIDTDYFHRINKELYIFTKINLEYLNKSTDYLSLLREKNHGSDILSIIKNYIGDGIQATKDKRFCYSVSEIVNDTLVKSYYADNQDYLYLTLYALNHDKQLSIQSRKTFEDIISNTQIYPFFNDDSIKEQIDLLSESHLDLAVKTNKLILDHGLGHYNHKDIFRI